MKRIKIIMEETGYPDHPLVGVGAVVFKNDRVLLVKRGQPPSAGFWAIPGGRVELGETLQQAAEREILEETGIVIHALEPVLMFDYIERDETGKVRYHYVIIDLKAEYISGELQSGSDAMEARWFSFKEIDEYPLNEKTKALLKKFYTQSDGNRKPIKR